MAARGTSWPGCRAGRPAPPPLGRRRARRSSPCVLSLVVGLEEAPNVEAAGLLAADVLLAAWAQEAAAAHAAEAGLARRGRGLGAPRRLEDPLAALVAGCGV